jgi:hypothetical protein
LGELVLGVLLGGLLGGLVLALLIEWLFERSAVTSRLTLVWPSTRRQLLDFLRRAGRGLIGDSSVGWSWGRRFSG